MELMAVRRKISQIDDNAVREFREFVWSRADELYRDMPWRDEPTLYHVLVSELMLQQTQVSRVLVKFAEFMTAFPTIKVLASASLADVLKVWTGLGYNRRAKYLHAAAKMIVADSREGSILREHLQPEFSLLRAQGGRGAKPFPQDSIPRKREEGVADTLTGKSVHYENQHIPPADNVRSTLKCPQTEHAVSLDVLTQLPGVGKNTAAAIMNYVYEIPTPFVETNIRTVYFKHFFAAQTDVTDKQILEVVDQTMDREHPREWFWALMDYGAWLKSQGEGRLDASKHYKKQSPLRGSVREVRGQIIRALGEGGMNIEALRAAIQADDRFAQALEGLRRDGLVSDTGGDFYLTR